MTRPTQAGAEGLLAVIRASFGEGLPKDALGNDQPVFNWGLGVYLSALAAMEMRGDLIAVIDAGDAYWNSAPPVPGYDVLPIEDSRPTDRYYDDNAWMVMSLVEAYGVTGREGELDRAERTMEYVLSGLTPELGGGVLWRESDKATKNACANAPAVAAILALEAHRPGRMAAAREIYGWTKANFEGADGLFTDHIVLANGTRDETRWSYNSALMIRAALGLGEGEDARRYARAAAERWVRLDGAIADEGRFAHLLAENLIAYEAATGDRLFDPAATAAYLPGLRDADGLYGKRWDAPAAGSGRELIDQASVLRFLAVSERR